MQLSLFTETVTEVEGEGVRYILRKNPQEAERERRRLEDKLAKLKEKVEARNQQVRERPRSQPEAGRRKIEAWAGQHKLTGLVEIRLEGAQVKAQRNEAAITQLLELSVGWRIRGDDRCGEGGDERAASL